MAICKKITRKEYRVCTGDLSKRIQLKIRKIQTPFGNSVDFNEDFSDLKTVWAMVETSPGEVVFDGTNTTTSVTHKFYIRYIPNVTFENWILYKDKYYDIINLENLNEANEFYLLRTNLRGASDLPVNFA